jgi:hypothetical protein
MYEYVGPDASVSSRDMRVLYQYDTCVVATDAKYLEGVVANQNSDLEILAIKYDVNQFNMWYKKRN